MENFIPRREIIKQLKTKEQLQQKRQEKLNNVLQKNRSLFKKIYKKLQESKGLFFSFFKDCLLKFNPYLRKLTRLGFLFLKKIKKILSVSFCSSLSFLSKFYTKLLHFFWNYRLSFGLMFLLIFLGLNCYFQILDKSGDNFKFSQKLNYFPQNPNSYFSTSQAYFNLGNETQAITYFKQGERLLKKYQKFELGFLFSQKYQQTKQLLEKPQQLRSDLQTINNFMISYPYSWQLVLRKAKIYKQLFDGDNLNQALNLVYWLNPDYPIPSELQP